MSVEHADSKHISKPVSSACVRCGNHFDRCAFCRCGLCGKYICEDCQRISNKVSLCPKCAFVDFAQRGILTELNDWEPPLKRDTIHKDLNLSALGAERAFNFREFFIAVLVSALSPGFLRTDLCLQRDNLKKSLFFSLFTWLVPAIASFYLFPERFEHFTQGHSTALIAAFTAISPYFLFALSHTVSHGAKKLSHAMIALHMALFFGFLVLVPYIGQYIFLLFFTLTLNNLLRNLHNLGGAKNFFVLMPVVLFLALFTGII